MDQNSESIIITRWDHNGVQGIASVCVCVCTCERENRGVLRFRQRDTFFLVVLLASIMASHEASSIHALFYSTKHKKNILLSRNYYSIYYYCLV